MLSCFFVLICFVSTCNPPANKTHDFNQQKIQLSTTDSLLVSDSNKYSVILPTHSNGYFRYDLDNPEEKYVLPRSLTEISGLAYYKKNKLLCVQDEDAEIFVYDLDSKEILSKFNFGKNGDYEGITIVGQTVYVIRSDGRIFEVENFDKKSISVREHKTLLSSKNNAEGLTYDSISNSLFIACKESPAIDNEYSYKGYRAIYQFDLGKMILNRKPGFLVELSKPDSYKDGRLFEKNSSEDGKKNRLTRSETRFQPSGIAIDPIHDEIYLINNIGKILIVLDRQGKVLFVQDLDNKIFSQPEGICFSPSGDLFISNEGRGGLGYILKFKLLRE